MAAVAAACVCVASYSNLDDSSRRVEPPDTPEKGSLHSQHAGLMAADLDDKEALADLDREAHEYTKVGRRHSLSLLFTPTDTLPGCRDLTYVFILLSSSDSLIASTQ